MGRMLQWKASYCRADGSYGRVYLDPSKEALGVALMDSILRWDTAQCYLVAAAAAPADRLAQARVFFAQNHITAVRVRPLDDEVDATSDA